MWAEEQRLIQSRGASGKIYFTAGGLNDKISLSCFLLKQSLKHIAFVVFINPVAFLISQAQICNNISFHNGAMDLSHGGVSIFPNMYRQQASDSHCM